MRPAIEPKLYWHYKGGFYVALGEAKDSTNGQVSASYVVYYSLTTRRLFIRAAGEFHEPVKWPDGGWRPRFVPYETEIHP